MSGMGGLGRFIDLSPFSDLVCYCLFASLTYLQHNSEPFTILELNSF